MREELENKLKEKYPQIFRERFYGCECSDGWYALIDTLCMMLSSRYNETKNSVRYIQENLGKKRTYGGKVWEQVDLDKAIEEMRIAQEEVPVAVQVKEKFGGLRFYVNTADETQNAYIAMAEAMAEKTCEVCGSTDGARLWSRGWMRTLCEKHAVEQYGQEEVDKMKGTYNE